MKPALTPLTLSLLALIADSSAATDEPQGQVWQADVQIRTLEVTKSKSSMTARVVIYNERDDDARDARLVVLLPLGVGIDRLAPGCAAKAGPSMVPSLRAAVECDLGSIQNRGIKEVVVITTVPPDVLAKRFGVFVYSSTPDPIPGNNYAERTIQ
jgi:hypothetical protein